MKQYSRKITLFVTLLLTMTFVVNGVPAEAAVKYYNMKVHYIDVGESDSVLIESNGSNMLIDAGENGDGDDIVSYLKKQKVKKLDYVICTHPHEDHIGGMDDVIKSFKIGKVIMPNKTHTTQTFEDVLDAVEKKGLKLTKPKVGTTYKIGTAKFTIIAPNNYNYGDNLNNYSVGIKLINGKTSFVFIGDCETEAIADILKNKISIKADVYMCGHHASDTSTTKNLLKAINPKYAVISVGKNSYGHPGNNTLKMLSDRKITTYRTDENGTIIATSTGNKVTFNAKATKYKTTTQKSASSSSESSSNVVYVTKTGSKYHRASCSYLKGSKIKTTVKEAKKDGCTPCSKCNPPK